MHSKTNPNEAAGSSRLSEITNNEDNEADDPLPKSVRKNISVSALGNKEANMPRVLEKPGPLTRYDTRTTLPGVHDTIFSSLKISDGEPVDLPTAGQGRKRNDADLVAATKPREQYGLAEALAFGTRFSEPEQCNADGYGDWSNEDYSVERRLARKLTCRFDEPAHAPHQTLMKVLKPYMAAAGFFAFVGGGAAIYYTEGGPFSRLETAGSAIAEPSAMTDPQAIQAERNIAALSAANSGEEPVEDWTASMNSGIQHAVLKVDGGSAGAVMIPVMAGGLGLEAGWTQKAITRESRNVSLSASPSGEGFPANLDMWTETVATFKMFTGPKPPQQIHADNSENEALLKRLEAWQDAKGSRE
jgi:hypothetical protein